MLRNKVVTLALAGFMALGLTACGDDQANDQADGQATGSDTTSSEAAATEEDGAGSIGEVDLEDAKEFVKITTCEGAPAKSAGVAATVEVTNTLDEPIEYYGSVNFLDGSGVAVTQGVFNTGTLEPGATSTEDVPGPNVYEAVPNVTCELIDVKTDEPA
jgi:hypothetical protein